MAGKKVRLNFFGHTYFLAGDEDEDLEAVVAYVEEVAQHIASEHQGLAQHKLVVLTVLHIAQEYMALKRGFSAYKSGFEGVVKRLAERIDEILISAE